MRLVVVGLGALALAGLVLSAGPGPASAAKTKMGCERGKQVWNATQGQCVAGKSKYRMAARKAGKPAAGKKKAAPKADAKK
ncbi:MAG TPA: hypothetical protein VG758_16895 [Hyphomicrobiaceae bacterium]|nr:hypothetical protein [Hyphomicrobiaceae bacterium]